MSTPRVCVTGSFMVDLVWRVARLPERGETLQALDFGIFLGGKGFNQALAARRMGAEVAMIGRLGDDEFAPRFLAALDAAGIDRRGVTLDPTMGTGVATPIIETGGNNRIVIAPRANMAVSMENVEAAGELVAAADVLLLQLEIPPEASMTAARIARAAGRRVILNPAPVLPMPDELLRLADIVTPNEVEAAALTGLPVTSLDEALTAADRLCVLGARQVVITLGAAGAVAVSGGERRYLPAHRVTAMDTTAAGDAFNGALAVRLAETGELGEALRWANAAGALAVTRLGAEPSLPHRVEVGALLGSA